MEILINLSEVKNQLDLEKSNEAFNFPFIFYKSFLDEEHFFDDGSLNFKLIGSPKNCSSFIINGKMFFCATQGLNNKICERLPISDFDLIDNSANFEKEIICSLNTVIEINENYFNIIADFIKLFYFTRISNGNQITSATFPVFPFCSFFSERATFHLPPFYENKKNKKYILSENIYHEAIHQSVNLAILTGEILNPEFNYKTSNKINIPWRNKFWELDRVLHATFVYGHLIQYRTDALKKFPELTFLKTLIDESIGCYKYLRGELIKAEADFTKFGFEQITKKLPPTSVWQ